MYIGDSSCLLFRSVRSKYAVVVWLSITVPVEDSFYVNDKIFLFWQLLSDSMVSLSIFHEIRAPLLSLCFSLMSGDNQDWLYQHKLIIIIQSPRPPLNISAGIRKELIITILRYFCAPLSLLSNIRWGILKRNLASERQEGRTWQQSVYQVITILLSVKTAARF